MRIVRMDRVPPMFTAKRRTVREDAGFRLTFFCEICGSGYVTPPLACDTPKEAVRLGEQDARLHFNRCGSCHRWVCDEHFNENQMMCIDCAPRICARCGTTIPKGVDLCTICGTSLALAVCPKCKGKNAQQVHFCNLCGASMAAPAAAKCSGCGGKNPPGTKFCGGCGTKL